eukprot:3775859-Pleurochrysis_carterae.AAC.2
MRSIIDFKIARICATFAAPYLRQRRVCTQVRGSIARAASRLLVSGGGRVRDERASAGGGAVEEELVAREAAGGGGERDRVVHHLGPKGGDARVEQPHERALAARVHRDEHLLVRGELDAAAAVERLDLLAARHVPQDAVAADARRKQLAVARQVDALHLRKRARQGATAAAASKGTREDGAGKR